MSVPEQIANNAGLGTVSCEPGLAVYGAGMPRCLFAGRFSSVAMRCLPQTEKNSMIPLLAFKAMTHDC